MDVTPSQRRAGVSSAVNARAALLAVGTVLGAGAALRFALPSLVRLDWNARIDDLVGGVLIGVGAILAGWYLLTALLGLLCLIARGSGAAWRRGEAALSRAGAPLLRRALGAGAGAALVTGSLLGPAYAAPEDSGDVPVDLTWAGEHTGQDRDGDRTDEHRGATTPQEQDHGGTPSDPSEQAAGSDPAEPGGDPRESGRSDGPPEQESAAETPDSGAEARSGQVDEPASTGHEADGGGDDVTAQESEGDPEPHEADEQSASPSPESDPHRSDVDGETGTQAQTYTVRPGDSLWRIAAAHLPDGSTDAEIAENWPRWYQANAETIGADPELIHPGQALDHPERSTR